MPAFTTPRKDPGPPKAWSPPAPFDFFALPHGDQWFAHVQAGRIGKRPTATPEQLARHRRNERIVLGLGDE